MENQIKFYKGLKKEEKKEKLKKYKMKDVFEGKIKNKNKTISVVKKKEVIKNNND